jgi:hypothetical protein
MVIGAKAPAIASAKPVTIVFTLHILEPPCKAVEISSF